MTSLPASTCTSSRTSTTDPDSRRIVFTRSAGRSSSPSRLRGTSSDTADVPPVASAAVMEAQNLAGSLSPSSRLSQATRRDLAFSAAHTAQATVLPEPAGAAIIVTGRAVARSISSVSRSRLNTSSPRHGMRTLLSRSRGSTPIAMLPETADSSVTCFTLIPPTTRHLPASVVPYACQHVPPRETCEASPVMGETRVRSQSPTKDDDLVKNRGLRSCPQMRRCRC